MHNRINNVNIKSLLNLTADINIKSTNIKESFYWDIERLDVEECSLREPENQQVPTKIPIFYDIHNYKRRQQTSPFRASIQICSLSCKLSYANFVVDKIKIFTVMNPCDELYKFIQPYFLGYSR